jgi:hypothetical protein
MKNFKEIIQPFLIDLAELCKKHKVRLWIDEEDLVVVKGYVDDCGEFVSEIDFSLNAQQFPFGTTWIFTPDETRELKENELEPNTKND